MSKKSIKIISILLTTVLALIFLTTTTFAAAKPSEFATGGTDVSGQTLSNVGKNIITTIRTVAMIISVVVLMVLGIKYMMGSAEEKASYKKTMMPYIVGAVLVFGAAAISDMVFTFASELGK